MHGEGAEIGIRAARDIGTSAIGGLTTSGALTTSGPIVLPVVSTTTPFGATAPPDGTMTPAQAREKREQMLRDGFCVIDDVVPPDLLAELKAEADRLNDDEKLHDPTAFYQGTHIGVNFAKNPTMERLANLPQARAAVEALGFGDFNHGGGMIVLTKEAAGKKASAPLYWHHDGSLWNDPLCATPWPNTVFFNYYLEDASVEGGCLKVIPGTHLQRIPLHDTLITAHEGGGGNDGGARSISIEDHPHMFADHPAQVNVLSKAGSLVLGDMRLLHAAHRNMKPTRRNLLLIWHSRPADTVPDYWQAEDRPVPAWLAQRLEDGPPPDCVTTRVQGTGVELEVPESLRSLGLGSLMRNKKDGVLPPGALDRKKAAAAKL